MESTGQHISHVGVASGGGVESMQSESSSEDYPVTPLSLSAVTTRVSQDINNHFIAGSTLWPNIMTASLERTFYEFPR